MFRVVIVFCAFVACLGAPQGKVTPPAPAKPATPQSPAPASGQGVYCGEAPNNMIDCLGNPNVFNKELSKKCSRRHLSECDIAKCLFRESGWAGPADSVDKQKVAQYFNEFVLDNGNWTAAVNHLKAACLDKELAAQGASQDCAPYDVLHCILTSFIRNAPEAVWRPVPTCAYPRQFAAACPYCPASCFQPRVPLGTCNACLSLPRTP